MLLTAVILYILSVSAATIACCDNAFPHCPPPNRGFAIFVFNVTMRQHDFLINGSNFYENILQWDEQKIAQFRQEAIYFFEEKFGIRTPAANPDVMLMNYQTNPAAGMRCLVLSGEDFIPTNGFTVLDAGWMVIVMNKSGITLGGEFSGVHTPYGTTFSTGHWLIQREDKAGTPRPWVLWKNMHAAPGGVAATGSGRTFHGEMDVISEEWGSGKSLHIAKYEFDAKGNATALLRNTITF